MRLECHLTAIVSTVLPNLSGNLDHSELKGQERKRHLTRQILPKWQTPLTRSGSGRQGVLSCFRILPAILATLAPAFQAYTTVAGQLRRDEELVWDRHNKCLDRITYQQRERGRKGRKTGGLKSRQVRQKEMSVWGRFGVWTTVYGPLEVTRGPLTCHNALSQG